MKIQSQSAFSLIELVTVILLIGILSAVAVPRLFQSTDEAHKAVALGTLANMKSSIKLMRSEWLLAGKPNPYQVDGHSILMSRQGYPINIVDADNPNQFNVRKEFCVWLAFNVAGISDERTITEFEFDALPDEDARRKAVEKATWSVRSLDKDAAHNQVDEDICELWYITGNYLQLIRYYAKGVIDYEHEDTWKASLPEEDSAAVIRQYRGDGTFNLQ